MNILKKIQNQPEHIRKIIFWSIVILIGLGLVTWWVKNVHQRLKSFQAEEFKEELKIPSLQEKLRGLPKIEIPKINEEELKKLEEILKPGSDEK